MADRRLQVFHAVAKHLSFTKAAEALFMTQPAVTSQIRQLEEHFNTRLFDRGHGRISLTAAGNLALEYVERILEVSAELDSRLQEMSGQLGGPLLIGASTTIADYLLPRVLGAYKARFPAVVPRLFVANSEAVQNRVAERSLDLGFIEGDSHLALLATDVCCEDELQVTCAPSHPLAKLKAATPESLTHYANISREPGSGTREVIDHYLQEAGVAPDAPAARDGTRQPGGLEGAGCHRAGVRHHVARDRRQRDPPRAAGADSARAAPHPPDVGRLSQGADPLATGEQLRPVREAESRRRADRRGRRAHARS